MSKYFTTQLLCKFNRLTLYSELNDEGEEGEDDVDDMIEDGLLVPLDPCDEGEDED